MRFARFYTLMRIELQGLKVTKHTYTQLDYRCAHIYIYATMYVYRGALRGYAPHGG